MFLYSLGDKVKVIHNVLTVGHVRTPWYVQGKCGHVAKIHGEFANPECLAYGTKSGVYVNLYMVEFKLMDIWINNDANDCQDSISVDIFEHWLTLN